MRIVIKPAGAVLLSLSFSILLFLVYFGHGIQNRHTEAMGSALAATDQKPQVSTTPAPVLVPGDSLVLDMTVPQAATVSTSTTTIPGVDSPVADYKVTLSKMVTNPWDITLHAPVDGDVQKNEAFVLKFRARSAQDVPFIAVFEHDAPPFPKSLSQEVKTDDEWQQYSLPFHAIDTYSFAKAQVTFHLGSHTGTVEIADVHLEPAN